MNSEGPQSPARIERDEDERIDRIGPPTPRPVGAHPRARAETTATPSELALSWRKAAGAAGKRVRTRGVSGSKRAEGNGRCRAGAALPRAYGACQSIVRQVRIQAKRGRLRKRPVVNRAGYRWSVQVTAPSPHSAAGGDA